MSCDIYLRIINGVQCPKIWHQLITRTVNTILVLRDRPSEKMVSWSISLIYIFSPTLYARPYLLLNYVAFGPLLLLFLYLSYFVLLLKNAISSILPDAIKQEQYFLSFFLYLYLHNSTLVVFMSTNMNRLLFFLLSNLSLTLSLSLSISFFHIFLY